MIVVDLIENFKPSDGSPERPQKLDELRDYVVFTNIEHALRNTESVPNHGGPTQEIAALRDFTFIDMLPNETLFVAGHGLRGQLVASGTPSVTIQGALGLDTFLSKAIKATLTRMSMAKFIDRFPRLIVIQACWGATRLGEIKGSNQWNTENAPSLITGIAKTLAENDLFNTKVIGYRGPSLLSPFTGPARVCLERFAVAERNLTSEPQDLGSLQSMLEREHEIEHKVTNITGDGTLSIRKKANMIADATKDFFIALVTQAGSRGFLYEPKAGTCASNARIYKISQLIQEGLDVTRATGS